MGATQFAAAICGAIVLQGVTYLLRRDVETKSHADGGKDIG